jgi:hypothetical protein
MLRTVPFLLATALGLVALSCNDDVVQTGEITTWTNPLYANEFSTYRTFSVITEAQIPDEVPDLGEDQDDFEAFNRKVNQLIIEAMQAEPVCLEYVPAEQTSEQEQPDLWAANGLRRSTNGGYVYECCGGWWWGWWGWYWDPCAYWCPTYVQYDVGSLFVPVGLPVASTGDPDVVFGGLAQSVLGTGQQVDDELLRNAIQAIFNDWPDPRQCSE